MPDIPKFINPLQIGGIDSYLLADGPGRGGRVLVVNTGAGLRYRVLVDRGLDLDQATLDRDNLTFLSYGGVTPPERGLDRGEDWQKTWAAGLLTSCGPMNIGPPGVDNGDEVGRHGTHSNTAATLESVIQPDPRVGKFGMSITGTVRYGGFYGPLVELRRTIRSTLGQNTIEFDDQFVNVGNTPVPHAWLLHINFGYPLVDEGSELCFDSPRVEPINAPESRRRFGEGENYKLIPPPLARHAGSACAVAYLYPTPDADGIARVGIVNRRTQKAVAIRYNTRQFPRCGNWQHFGVGEYVTALEPMNGTVNGRAADRAAGVMDELAPGERREYQYSIEVLNTPEGLDNLLRLNG